MTNFLTLLLLITLVVLTVGLVRPRLVLFGEPRTRGRVGFIYGFLAAIIFVAFGNSLPPEGEAAGEEPAIETVAAEPEPEPQPAPPADPAETLKAAVEKMADITVELEDRNGKFQIAATYKPTAIWSTSSYVSGLGMQLNDIGRYATKSGVPVEGFSLAAWTPTTDKYGNSGVGLAFVLEVKPEDYAQVNWEGIGFDQLLNLAEVTATPLGKKAAATYCADEDNLRSALAFCRAALGS